MGRIPSPARLKHLISQALGAQGVCRAAPGYQRVAQAGAHADEAGLPTGRCGAIWSLCATTEEALRVGRTVMRAVQGRLVYASFLALAFFGPRLRGLFCSSRRASAACRDHGAKAGLASGTDAAWRGPAGMAPQKRSWPPAVAKRAAMWEW